MQAGSQMH